MRQLGIKLLLAGTLLVSLGACTATYHKPNYSSVNMIDVDCRNAHLYMKYWYELLDKPIGDSSASTSLYNRTLMHQIERTQAKCGVQ